MRPAKQTCHLTALLVLGIVAAAWADDDDHPRFNIQAALAKQTQRTYTFTALEVPGAERTFPEGINAGGDIVGTYVAAGVAHGFLLSGGVYTTIDYPGAAVTEVRGIGPGGEIVGSYNFPGDPPLSYRGFLVTKQGEFLNADYPGHTSTIPERILPDGTILGCRHDNDFMETMRGIVISANGNE